MATGIIMVGRGTKSHAQTLRALGYGVKELDGRIEIEVSSFEETLDLTAGAETLAQFVKARKALTYKSKVLYKEQPESHIVKEVSNLAACRVLGSLSCLVMHDGSKMRQPKSKDSQLSELLALLNK